MKTKLKSFKNPPTVLCQNPIKHRFAVSRGFPRISSNPLTLGCKFHADHELNAYIKIKIVAA